jgi:uncharacterized membrane protein
MKDNRTIGQRCSDAVCEFCGSWSFILVSALFTAAWFVRNTYQAHPWDPWPFIFLNLVFTVVELFQSPLILMSENRQKERELEKTEHDREVWREMNQKLDLLITRTGLLND